METTLITLSEITLGLVLLVAISKYRGIFMGSHTLTGTKRTILAATKKLDQKGIANMRHYKKRILTVHPLRKNVKALKKICKEHNLKLTKDSFETQYLHHPYPIVIV